MENSLAIRHRHILFIVTCKQLCDDDQHPFLTEARHSGPCQRLLLHAAHVINAPVNQLHSPSLSAIHETVQSMSPCHPRLIAMCSEYVFTELQVSRAAEAECTPVPVV